MEPIEVRARLKSLGRTQAELADFLGMHPGVLSLQLSGKRRMWHETMRRIEAFLAEPESTTRGVAETAAPFLHGGLNFVTLEEARKIGCAPRMSEEDRERWHRELRELGEAARRLPRITNMTDEEILGYDEMA